jgi:hypothetical protein
LVPRESVEAASNAIGEVLQTTRDGSQRHDLGQLPFRVAEVLPCSLDPGPEALGTFCQLLQIERTHLVGIEQALEATFVIRQHAGGFVALRPALVLSVVGS